MTDCDPPASARKGGKGLTVGIGVGAVLTVGGHRALGGAAFRRHGADRHAQYGLVGPLHHHVHVLRGPLRRRPHHLVHSEGLRHAGLRRDKQGGGVDVHLLHRPCHRLRRRGSGAASACVGAFRLFQSGFASHVGHRRPFTYTLSFRRSIFGRRFAPKPERCRRGLSRAVSVVALVCAVLVHSVTAWIFGLQQAHEFWHTALLAPWFVSSALVCGTALVLVVAIALRRAGYLSLDQSYVVKLVKMLGAFVVVDLYFFGCDLLTSRLSGKPRAPK